MYLNSWEKLSFNSKYLQHHLNYLNSFVSFITWLITVFKVNKMRESRLNGRKFDKLLNRYSSSENATLHKMGIEANDCSIDSAFRWNEWCTKFWTKNPITISSLKSAGVGLSCDLMHNFQLEFEINVRFLYLHHASARWAYVSAMRVWWCMGATAMLIPMLIIARFIFYIINFFFNIILTSLASFKREMNLHIA